MGKPLVIVESPHKAKTIQKYVGDTYRVQASSGHIRDLPEKELGVDLDGDYSLSYEITAEAKKKKTVPRLKEAAKDADAVILATDPDREGEAIAYHLAQVLGRHTYRRVTFNEVNETAVQAALAQPGEVDVPLVRAQEARRATDRLTGYLVSPALSQAANQKLSAGRVQSVAVRLIVDREREIKNFTPTTHYGVLAHLTTDQVAWKAEWQSGPMLPEGQKYCLDRELAQTVADGTERVKVSSVEKKTTKKNAPGPFTSSTLQQVASKALGIGVDDVMNLAQKLFEGPEGFDHGLITYHRTDSVNLSDESNQAIRDWLTDAGYAVPDRPNKFKQKSENAQEAHEAIRPSDITRTKLETGDANLDALYRLIWIRAVASQMPAAEYAVTQITLQTTAPVAGRVQEYRAGGKILTKPGWMALTQPDEEEDEDQANGSNAQSLPAVTEGQELTVDHTEVAERKTKPPERYTESSLVKALEDNGIGRPSTFASIVATIRKRGFTEVAKKKRVLTPTENAFVARDALVGTFSFMELDFTANMEQALDQVARGELGYRDVIAAYHQRLKQELPHLEAARLPSAGPQHDCPECGKPMRQRTGKSGKFWGCTGDPDCTYTVPDAGGKPGKPIPKDAVATCQCGGEVFESPKAWKCRACEATVWKSMSGKTIKESQAFALLRGETVELKGLKSRKTQKKFDAKAAIEDGKVAFKFDEKKTDDTPAVAAGDTCPQCKKGSVKKKSLTNGENAGKEFYGCSRYPDCRLFKWVA